MSLERTHPLIQRSTTPPEAVIQLLENTFIGTNGTRYQLLDTRTKIHDLVAPQFFYIQRNDRAIGNVTICERPLKPTINGHYIRYFAFSQSFQGGTKKGNGQSALHHYFRALFATSNQNPIAPEREKSIYWAFIDPDNLRSFQMNEQMGFQSIGTFRTFAFSRFRPKKQNVSRISPNEHAAVLREIQNFYADFHFFSPVHLFDHGNYFVLKEKGEIVCGIQANPCHWKIKELPGTSGKALLRMAPHIPYLNRILNPKNHRFLATGGLFWKAGHSDKVELLLEGVLAETKHHSALIWADHANPSLSTLNINWGMLQRLKKDNPIQIIARFIDFTEEEIDAYRKKPKYLSGFDMT